MKFPAHAVLGVTTARLLGDIGGIYSVMSFLIGRPAYTHDLVYYAARAKKAIAAVLPDLPGPREAKRVDGKNYRQYLDKWENQFGAEIELPDSLRDCLADEKSAVETATEMVGADRVTAIKV